MAQRKFSDQHSRTKRQQQAGVGPAKKKMAASRKLSLSVPVITVRWGNKKLEIENFVKLLTSVVVLISTIVALIAAIISQTRNKQIPCSTSTTIPSYTISATSTWSSGLINTSSVTATTQLTNTPSSSWAPIVTVTLTPTNLVTKSLPPISTHNAYPSLTSTTILSPAETLIPTQSSTITSTSADTAIPTNMSTSTPLASYTSTSSETPTGTSVSTDTPSMTATATSSHAPTYTQPATPTPTSTASTASLTPVSIDTSTLTPTPSDLPTSPGYTPTYVPTFTPTPLQTEHKLYVTHRSSCHGWEVNVTTDPSDAVINYSPAQLGDWAKENRVRVVVTALWSDGTSEIKEVKLQKPEDCEDTTLTPTQASTPLATSTPVWAQTQTITATPSLSYTVMPTPPINEDVQGCSPGYWKNHLESWQQTGYSPTDDFDTVFQVNIFSPDITLEQALNFQGGGDGRLARHGVAALLNASDPETNYPLNVQQVIVVIQADDIDKLAEFNELDCPLH